MSGIIEMIDSNEQSRRETIATTVRMSEEVSAQIEGLVDYLDTTKNEVMINLLKTALNQAYEHIDKKEPDTLTDVNQDGVTYYLFNTNKGYQLDDHYRMLSDGHIECFGEVEQKALKTIKKNDIVFLYVNGEGIVAYGKASGVIKTGHRYDDPKQEAYRYQELTGFKSLSEKLKTSAIYKALGKKICCLHRLSIIKDGEKLFKLIKN